MIHLLHVHFLFLTRFAVFLLVQQAMKVQELKDILGSLGQNQSGLKAGASRWSRQINVCLASDKGCFIVSHMSDLVSRILEHQSQPAAAAAQESTPAPTAAAATDGAPESTPVADSAEGEQTATTTTGEASAAAAAVAEKPALDVDAELEKRKARAAKFGTATEDASVDKKRERAKRFGTGADAVAASVSGMAHTGASSTPHNSYPPCSFSQGMDKLDQALSNRRERKGGSGRGRRGRRGGNSGSSENRSSAAAPASKPTSGSGYAKSTDPAELEKQAKRAARFQAGPDDSNKVCVRPHNHH